jgi:hypothetical protein
MQASGRDHEPSSWTLRVLVPLALVATFGALVIVIAGSVSSSDDDGEETTSTTTTTTTAKGCGAEPPNPPADAAVEAGFYVIKPGESLGTVTERTCVQDSMLLRLNPDLDPLQLPVGACVNLEPDGCKNAG